MPLIAQTEEAAELPPGVRIDVSAEPRTVTVGDHIRIDFDVTLPEGYEAEFPYPGDRAGDFAILEFLPGPAITDQATETVAGEPAEGASLHHFARITAALYRTGEFDFPPISLMLRTPGDEALTVFTPSISIMVESVLTAEKEELKDLKNQAEIEAPFNWLFWISLSGLIMVLAGIGWWLWRRKLRPAEAPAPLPQRDPLEAAEADLKGLLKRGHLESGRVKQFYVSLAEIVKRILGAGYDIQTIEKTTAEILEDLRGNAEEMPAQPEPEEVEGFLLSCDLVKFAKYLPSKFENDEAVQDAFKILEECRQLRSRQPDPVAAPVGGTGS